VKTRMTMTLLLALAVSPVTAAAFSDQSVAAPQPSPAAQWHADLAFLRSKLLAMHPNPFSKVSRAQFDREADQLDQSFSGLSREAAIVGIMRLVARLGDGHTAVLPGPQTRAGFHLLPLRFYFYGDDPYLDGADRAYAAGLGGRLTAINGIAAQEVIRRVREVTPGDNKWTVAGRLPAYLIVPEVLAGLGIIASVDAAVPISLEVGGKTVTVAVEPIKSPESRVAPGIATNYGPEWSDRSRKPAPLWLRSPSKAYWSDYDAKTGTLYVQYNSCVSDPADPMPEFSNRLEQSIGLRQARRVIVDLRLNQGGNSYWNRYLVRALLHSTVSSKEGRFFVLIGRQTFSAGSMMAIELEKYTEAVFVGEPSGGSVQGFGDHDLIVLPNSGLGVMISAKFFQNDGPNDNRSAIVPQAPVSLTVEDYGSGRDPVLEAALSYRVPPATVAKPK
jgi:hypothetical protein